MSTCLICGKSSDGVTCSSHQEDVAFEFRGNRANQLRTRRHYVGTVDGFADFGVFIDIGERVTGLLHRSEVQGRLESLDWDSGDDVYVQVQGVQDNGNVDLGWSIAQDAREFRGHAIHDPTADDETEWVVDRSHSTGSGSSGESSGSAPRSTPNTTTKRVAGSASESRSASQNGQLSEADSETQETASGNPNGGSTAREQPAHDAPARDEPERVTIDALEDAVGERVLVEGVVVSIRQTSGPTVFGIEDETGDVECAAFVAAGERAYPGAELEDSVAVRGEVERHRGDLQIETEQLEVLADEESDAVQERLDSALEAEATPESTELLLPESPLDAHRDSLLDAATAVRRAISESRPIVVRHPATVDGFVAGGALERAVLDAQAETAGDSYHDFERRPLQDERYGMSDATRDVTQMLEGQARHDDTEPLFVFAGAAATRESLDALDLLAAYDTDRIAIDSTIEVGVQETLDVSATGSDDATTSVLCANVAALVNDDVRAELRHLPAISYGDQTPDSYASLAADSGSDPETIQERREALALIAHYQSYSEKRELLQDLLWGDGGFSSYASAQFRAKLDSALDTALAHVEHREANGESVAVLDTAAFGNRFDFPPAHLVIDALQRRSDDAESLTVCQAEADLRLRAEGDLDVRAVADAVGEDCPDASVRARGTDQLEFLMGERDAVLEAVIDAATTQLAAESSEAEAEATVSGQED